MDFLISHDYLSTKTRIETLNHPTREAMKIEGHDYLSTKTRIETVVVRPNPDDTVCHDYLSTKTRIETSGA